MKKFLKALAVLAAVAALGFGFASCSDDDGDSGPSALAAFTYTTMTDGTTETESIYFYSNDTWARECVYTTENNYTDKDMSGTYAITSGDFTNGTLNFTVVVHEEEELGWKPVSLKIKDGIFYLQVWDSSPKVDVNDKDLHKYVKQ